jgi:hypothetical protein
VRNAVWLDFEERGVVKGEGYGILMDALFKKSAAPEDVLHFMFGAALDHVQFGQDVLLEALQLIRCNTAVLFHRGPAGWTAVLYRYILTENAERAEVGHADQLFARLIKEGEPTEEPTVTPKDEEGAFSRFLRLATGR